jgi:hypothetical protein
MADMNSMTDLVTERGLELQINVLEWHSTPGSALLQPTPVDPNHLNLSWDPCSPFEERKGLPHCADLVQKIGTSDRREIRIDDDL